MSIWRSRMRNWYHLDIGELTNLKRPLIESVSSTIQSESSLFTYQALIGLVHHMTLICFIWYILHNHHYVQRNFPPHNSANLQTSHCDRRHNSPRDVTLSNTKKTHFLPRVPCAPRHSVSGEERRATTLVENVKRQTEGRTYKTDR